VGTSETEEEIHNVAKSHGWSLDGVTVRHLETGSLEEEQTVLHPAEAQLPKTLEAVFAHIEEVDPARLVIDSLAELRVLARNELWYRRQLMTLKHRLNRRSCTVLLTEIPPPDESLLHSLVSSVIRLKRTSPP